MDPRDITILIIITNVCHKIVSDAKLNVIPRDTEVKVNDSTYMNCSTSLQAGLVQWRHGSNYVYTGIAILEPYNDGRFSVEIDASTGASNLVVRSVQPSDAGKYECSEDEGVGETRSAQLIVLDDDPTCKYSMYSGAVIGPNSCGIEPEEVKLSCSITYHGTVYPVLQWKASGDNEPITEGLFNVTSNNKEVTYTLTMNSTLHLSNSSYVCQTTRTSDKYYSCSSSAISILYIFSSQVTVNMTMNDEVNCFANTSQPCSYKWKWFRGDDSTTESDNQILRPKKVGWHRCEATCSFGNRSCTVESLHANVYSDPITDVHSDAATTTSSQSLLALLVLLVIPMSMIIIAALICHCRKAPSRAQTLERELRGLIEELPENYQSDLVLVKTIRTKAAEENNEWICGLTILDNELFVVTYESSMVEVYDSTKFSFIRRWNLTELIQPRDIGSCNTNKCLYIFDYKGPSSEILRVDPNGKLIKKWSPGNDSVYGLSVTDQANLLLAVNDRYVLSEYSPEGQLIREINLSSDADIICHPWRAILLANGHFVVSHGDCGDEVHRVCKVDAGGRIVKYFGGKCGSTIGRLSLPVYLCVDGNGFVMVADQMNRRVLLLDSDLEFRREMLPVKERHELQGPERILLNESTGQLFVVDNECNAGGRILIFTYKDQPAKFDKNCTMIETKNL